MSQKKKKSTKIVTEKQKKKDEKVVYGIILGLVWLFGVFFSLHMSAVARFNRNGSIFDIISQAFTHLEQHPFNLAFNSHTFGYVGVITLIILFGAAWLYYDTVIHRRGITKNTDGSAKWNDELDTYNEEFTDPPNEKHHNGDKNMILTQNIFLSMNSRQTLRNNNVLVIGGSGAGKSRFMVKPNILQANCNYVITDPAGELLESTGKFLEDNGYEVKVFNLVEMTKSDRYNPFNYIRDEAGVLMMINCLIRNTNPEGKGGGDPFWEKSETALLQALVFYLIKYRPKEEQNFTSVMKLLRAAEIDENNPNEKSKLDKIFDEIAIKDPNSIALKQYRTFKMGAGKTLKSILISTSVRLTVFNMKQIENLTKTDSLDLGSMGEDKKALFVIIPAADSTYNFLVSMMYSQLFETLYYVAETGNNNKRLNRPVRFMLDEFANIGQIPEFTKKLATMRKYEISCTIILQNLAQIKTMYKDDWESIVGNCDSFLFLGGQEQGTLKYISEQLGKETIETSNDSHSFGKNQSKTLALQRKARDLATADELGRMDNSECVLFIRGLYPFKDKKFDYPKHKNYSQTGDADKKLLYVNKKDNSEPLTKEQILKYYNTIKFNKYVQKIKNTIEDNDKENDDTPIDLNTFIEIKGGNKEKLMELSKKFSA